MPKRKYTRKQLRQPDEFISFSMRAWDLIRSHAPRVIIMVVVTIVVIGAAWTWTHLADARAAKATDVLSRALEIYNQSVIPAAEKLPPPAEGDPPRFKTHKEKLGAAEKEFTKTVEKSGGTLRALTRLARAGVRYELGMHDKALEDYQAFLSAGTGTKEMTVAAKEGIAYCYEGKKQWDKALDAFRKLPTAGEGKWIALYHEARILAKKDKKDEAVKLLKRVAEHAKTQAVKNRASDQLALIGAK